MRAGNDPKVYINTEGRELGLFTSADFCAEHECGTERLQQALKKRYFNVRDADCMTFGIANRMIDAELFKQNSVIVRTDKVHALIIQRMSYDVERRRRELVDHILSGEDVYGCYGLGISRLFGDPPRDIVSAWDQSSLGFAVGPKHFDIFDKVVKACEDGFGFLGFSKTLPVFDNGGYILMDARDLPADVVKKMEDDDRDVHALYEEHRRIDIESRLGAHNQKVRKETGKDPWSYDWDNAYAVDDDGTVYNPQNFHPFCSAGCLSPRWAGPNDGTKYKIIYWLNPNNQAQNFFGWVTVEDLEDWMLGKGKIPGRGRGLEHIQRTRRVASGSLDDLYSDEVFCTKCGIVNTERRAVDCCPKCGSEDIIKSKERCW